MGVAASLKVAPKRVDERDMSQVAAELADTWSNDELRMLMTVFRHVSSGAFTVSYPQFSAFCPMLYGLEPATRRRCFDLFDTDHNGLVDFKEFAVGVALSQRGSAEQRSRFVFQLYASDRERLTEDDLRRLLRDASGRVTSQALAHDRYHAYTLSGQPTKQHFKPVVYINEVLTRLRVKLFFGAVVGDACV
jgi:Ca2+-binding EF-hand superfamily protein